MERQHAIEKPTPSDQVNLFILINLLLIDAWNWNFIPHKTAEIRFSNLVSSFLAHLTSFSYAKAVKSPAFNSYPHRWLKKPFAKVLGFCLAKNYTSSLGFVNLLLAFYQLSMLWT